MRARGVVLAAVVVLSGVLVAGCSGPEPSGCAVGAFSVRKQTAVAAPPPEWQTFRSVEVVSPNGTYAQVQAFGMSGAQRIEPGRGLFNMTSLHVRGVLEVMGLWSQGVWWNQTFGYRAQVREADLVWLCEAFVAEMAVQPSGETVACHDGATNRFVADTPKGTFDRVTGCVSVTRAEWDSNVRIESAFRAIADRARQDARVPFACTATSC